MVNLLHFTEWVKGSRKSFLNFFSRILMVKMAFNRCLLAGASEDEELSYVESENSCNFPLNLNLLHLAVTFVCRILS